MPTDHADSSTEIRVSPTLGANEFVTAARAAGKTVHHMGFGEAPFPAPPRLVSALQANAHQKSYLPVRGLAELRQAILQHQARHAGVDPEAFDVFIAPGSKALLFGLQLAIPGDLLLPVPSWVSYAPQAELINTRVIPVMANPSDAGLGLTAEAVADAIHTARAKGLNPTKLLINFPSNPTGLTIDDASLNALITVCKQEGVSLISDEIYGRLSYDGVYRSAGALWPEGAIVTTGLSKHLSLGGWRLGVTLIPKAMPKLVARLEQIGSEIWSCVAAPVQHAAIEAYGHHADIDDFVTHSTNIHRVVNREIASRLRAMGARCAIPQGGFYTWPDFTEALAGRVATSDALSDELMTHCNLVTLPGSAFGDAPEHLTLRLSGCDYDGGRALTMTEGMDDDGIAAALPEFAPSVLQGLDKLGGFVRR